MRTIKPKTNQMAYALLVIFLFLISLIGCSKSGMIFDKGTPLIIDSDPPNTPKGFVEFYTFSGHYYPRKYADYPCYDLQKARSEYNRLAYRFSVTSSLGGYFLSKEPKVYRPKDFPLELDLPSYWRRFAMAPGEHEFFVSDWKENELFPQDRWEPFIVTVTEGMITLIRIEGQCIRSKKVTKLLKIVPSVTIPITSNEKSRALFKQLLNDSDWTIRFYTARILGEIGDPNTVELLIDALRDDVWEVRIQASFSLVKFKNVRDARIIDLITKALVEDSKEDNLAQMRHTARLLGEIGDERAIAPLERCLHGKYDPLYLKWELDGVKTDCSDALKKIRQRLNK